MALEDQCGFCGNFGHDGLDCPFPTARKVDAAEERARIRKKLLEWADPMVEAIQATRATAYQGAIGATDSARLDVLTGLRAALDRICPEEPAGERSDKKGE